MRFRTTLSHYVLGSQEINEMDGWKDAVLKLDRHEDFNSLIEYFDGAFIFYGNNSVNGGISFLKQVEAEFGPDAEVNILIEISLDDENYDQVFSGQVDLWELTEHVNNKLQAPIIREGFWANFINRKETPVNLQAAEDIDGNPSTVYDGINLSMTGQKINKRAHHENLDDQGIEENFVGGEFLQCDWDYVIFDELQEKYNLPILPNAELPVWIYEPKEKGLHTFDVSIFSFVLGTLLGIAFESVKSITDHVDFFFQINDDTPIAFSWVDINAQFYDPLDTITKFTYNASHQLNVGDVVRIYGVKNGSFTGSGIAFFVWNSNRFELLARGYKSYLKILAPTEYPDTQGSGFLLHDVAAHITDRIIGQEQAFYSEYLGGQLTQARQYDIDGCGWSYALLKGLQIRQYTLEEKPFFLSFMQWWNGANPVLNLGLGYEELNELIIQELVNDTFDSDEGWNNVDTGQDWVVTGGVAESVVTTGTTKYFRKTISQNTVAGSYSLQIIINVSGTGGSDSVQISYQILDENLVSLGGISHSQNFDSTGTVLSIVVNATAPARFLRFRAQINSGSDVTFQVQSVSLTGQVELTQVIRVEEKAHFYDEDVSISFSNVWDITRQYDKDHIFNKIEIGYQKWQSEDISGIDDPQTKHTYATLFKKASGENGRGGISGNRNIYSEFIAASLAIETTRRTTREKSADYKYDNDTFIIALNPSPTEISPETSPDVTDFLPELDENFDSITGLLNSDTRYNSRITPARNLLRWLNYLSGCLQKYLSSTFRFQSGEGNYDMTSEMDAADCDKNFEGNVLAESQSIAVSEDFLFLPLAYEMVIPMTWEEYKIIRDNRKKAIGISQTDENHTIFFVKSLSYKITKGEATILAWPKSFLDIQVIESTFTLRQCVPSEQEDECENAITDEFGQILTNEFGICITE